MSEKPPNKAWSRLFHIVNLRQNILSGATSALRKISSGSRRPLARYGHLKGIEMEKDDRLETIWCALNCFVEPDVIMREIEKVVGKRAVTQRWSRYFDSGNS